MACVLIQNQYNMEINGTQLHILNEKHEDFQNVFELRIKHISNI